jgi:hypothetical protein
VISSEYSHDFSVMKTFLEALDALAGNCMSNSYCARIRISNFDLKS